MYKGKTLVLLMNVDVGSFLPLALLRFRSEAGGSFLSILAPCAVHVELFVDRRGVCWVLRLVLLLRWLRACRFVSSSSLGRVRLLVRLPAFFDGCWVAGADL